MPDARLRSSTIFKNDVADETVAHDHVHVILEQIVTLDVADKIQIQLLAELEGFQREFVALGIFRADAPGRRRRGFFRFKTSRQ